MSDELTDLLDAAMYKEIASQAFYVAGQNKTQDPAAKALMKELAEEELKHLQWLKAIPLFGFSYPTIYRIVISNSSDYAIRLQFKLLHPRKNVPFYPFGDASTPLAAQCPGWNRWLWHRTLF